MSGENTNTPAQAPKFDWSSLLEILVGIGKNNKQYRRLVVKNDIAFDRGLVTKAMASGVKIKDIRNATGPEWGDDDLPSGE